MQEAQRVVLSWMSSYEFESEARGGYRQLSAATARMVAAGRGSGRPCGAPRTGTGFGTGKEPLGDAISIDPPRPPAPPALRRGPRARRGCSMRQRGGGAAPAGCRPAIAIRWGWLPHQGDGDHCGLPLARPPSARGGRRRRRLPSDLAFLKVGRSRAWLGNIFGSSRLWAQYGGRHRRSRCCGPQIGRTGWRRRRRRRLQRVRLTERIQERGLRGGHRVQPRGGQAAAGQPRSPVLLPSDRTVALTADFGRPIPGRNICGTISACRRRRAAITIEPQLSAAPALASSHVRGAGRRVRTLPRGS